MINAEDHWCWNRFRTRFRLPSVLEAVPDSFPPPVSEAVPEALPPPVSEAVPEALPPPVSEAVPEALPPPVPEALPPPVSEAVPEALPAPARMGVPEMLPTVMLQVRLHHFRLENRRQIGAAAEGLIGVYDGRQLLPFGLDQDPSRLKEVTLGQEHVEVIDTGVGKLPKTHGASTAASSAFTCCFLISMLLR